MALRETADGPPTVLVAWATVHLAPSTIGPPVRSTVSTQWSINYGEN